MSQEHLLPLLALAGGIALFLLGSEILVEALQRTAGARVRQVLSRLTAGRLRAAAAGTLASSVIHSGPTSIVILGFVSAGILSLSQAIPLIFGANIGTTLSMQIVAFNVGQYAFGVVALGMILQRIRRQGPVRDIGEAVAGFGLLFLGLETMKSAIAPLRETPAFESIVGFLHVSTVWGYLVAVLLGMLITALFQSSGVIISLLFSLSALGVITDYRVAVPFVLGAHIGTCSMTFLAAAGGSPTVWRVAFAHLLFNIIGGVLATLALPLFDLAIPALASDVTRQIAHFNTMKQVAMLIVMLPLAGPFEQFLLRATRRLGPLDEERSHLDPAYLATPERAILATTRELRRQAAIVDSMFRMSLDGLVSLDLRRFERVCVKERAVDVIRWQVQAYIARIAERNVNHRQAMMLQRLHITSNAIERIGDHVEDIGFFCRTKVARDIWFPDEHMQELLQLSALIREMLVSTMRALDPMDPESHTLAATVLKQRLEFKRRSRALKEAVHRSFGDGSASDKLYFLRYVMILDKIVSHLKAMARQESDANWAVEPVDLSQVRPVAPRPPGRPPQHPIHATFEEALRDSLQERSSSR